VADDLSEILFDLVSPDRLAIVSELSTRKLRLTALSKLSKHTVQECSRDLNRLSESGFVRKDSEGLYEITSLGRAMLSLVPGLKFLVKERKYFLSHDLSFLPAEFIERIGELLAGKRVDHTGLVLDHIRAAVSKAREYVWLISDQIMPRYPGMGSEYSKNVSVRMVAEQTIDKKILSETKSILPRSEVGFLHEVKIAMAINESIAGMCFPGLNGKIDFNGGFTGEDTAFRGWCTDLFEHYWSRSERSS
jgi:predicted transcriptional regulator